MSAPASLEAIDAYNVFASVYAARFGQEASRTLPVLERLVLTDLSAGEHILDVCCGTGQLAGDLIRLGFRVTGIDASEQMLRHAKREAPGASFVLADVRAFTSSATFDAAISSFNCFAHLGTADGLIRAFANVYRAVQSGGSFCFDLYMEPAYFRRWHGQFEVEVEGQRCRVAPSYDAASRTATNRIQLLDAASDEILREVTMTQHCFPRDVVIGALHAVGFKGIRTFDAAQEFGLADEEDRVFFLARKQMNTKGPAMEAGPDSS